MARVDVHQHVWPKRLVEALRRGTAGPLLDGWVLRLPGEPDYRVSPADHDPVLRAELAAADGLDTALVSLSSPLGIELLPPAQARPLLDAYHEGVLELPRPFAAWAAASVHAPNPAELAALLDAGCVGLQLPANALLDRAGYERRGPLLEVLQERGRPLFLHPGPAPRPERAGSVDTPPWWPALVPYVGQMHTAWFAWQAAGARLFPRLRVVFALLAGLAPLHGERCAARGAPLPAPDPRVFLETSSYGARAIEAVIPQVGLPALLLGSDRPYAEPVTLGPALDRALRVDNPARLLG